MTGHSRNHVAILIVLALAVAGCSDDDPTAPSVPTDYDHALSSEADGLRITVSTSKATYEFAEDVEVRITMMNISDQPQNLDFARGNPARFSNFNLSILDGDDSQHHASGDGERDTLELAPGESISATMTWNQNSRFGGEPVDRGFYRLSGRVDFDDRATLRVDRLFIELD